MCRSVRVVSVAHPRIREHNGGVKWAWVVGAVALVLAGCSGGGDEDPAVLTGSFTLGGGPPITTSPVSARGVLTYYSSDSDAAEQVRVTRDEGFRVQVEPGTYDLRATFTGPLPCEGPEQVTVSSGDTRTLDYICPVR